MNFAVAEQRRACVSPFILSPTPCISDSSIALLTLMMFSSQEGWQREILPPPPRPSFHGLREGVRTEMSQVRDSPCDLVFQQTEHKQGSPFPDLPHPTRVLFYTSTPLLLASGKKYYVTGWLPWQLSFPVKQPGADERGLVCFG